MGVNDVIMCVKKHCENFIVFILKVNRVFSTGAIGWYQAVLLA